MAVSGEYRLADGRVVVVRLAGPADVPAIAKLYQDLSPESFAGRFHGGRAAPFAWSPPRQPTLASWLLKPATSLWDRGRRSWR